jgi:acyl-CoA synthetase (AMP-forming)/AMP-acid ligase II
MDILPLGVAGELVIGGPLVVRGYHRLPEVTAKSFIEWPTKGCRAYRTGDLGIFVALVTDTRLICIYHTVRMTAERTLLVHGRIDSQIKLSGVRVESEGVSEVVRKSARGRTSVHTLIASHRKLGGEILVSFFVSDNPLIKVDEKRTSTPKISPGRNEELVPIRSAVQAELAVYMRPSHIIPLDFLPLTLNGKIDGKKLLEVFQQIPLEDLMKLQRSDVPDRATLASREPTDVEGNVISLVSRISGLPESQLSPA